MKKFVFLGLFLILGVSANVAYAENGAKNDPYVSVYNFQRSGITYTVMYGFTNIANNNPASTGSYVRLSNSSYGIRVDMFDVDNQLYAGCTITPTNVHYETAKQMANMIDGTTGIRIHATYNASSYECTAFLYTFMSSYN